MKKQTIKALTLKEAKALAIQELGTAKGLARSDLPEESYSMDIGRMNVTIRIICEYPNCLALYTQFSCHSSFIRCLYNRETLEEDFEAEECLLQQDAREQQELWASCS